MFKLDKMNLFQSILFFGIPGVLIFAGTYWLVPLLTEMNVPLIVSWTAAVWGPIVLLVIFVLWNFYQQPEREKFATRFRFKKLSGKEWLWVIGAFLVVQIFELMLSPSSAILARYPLFQPPAIIPDLFNPAFKIEEGLVQLMGVPLKGNWWLIAYWFLWLILNIGGEEFLWRGYALPLQEKVFGKYAWLVNGILWNVLVHLFFRWSFITLMPISLILPLLAQKFQNSWVGVLIHGTGNLLVLVIIIPGILG